MPGQPRRLFIVLAVAVVAACSSAGTPGPDGSATASAGDPTKDKLAQVLSRGTLVLSTDLEYPPQSSAVEGAMKASPTKCAANQMTAAEIEGYDADTGKLVAEALGVEPCFVTPPWSEVIGGNWGDRWDISWGSGAMTADRMSRLWVTQPYYSTPSNFFVPTDSIVLDPAELSGMEVGACAGCTMEQYLKHELALPGVTLEYLVDDPTIVTFDDEPPGLLATAEHDIDGFLCSEPVGAEAIAQGAALRMLETPAYATQKTGYLDRGSSLSQTAFAQRIDDILRSLHADGDLKALSMRWFGVDYAANAGSFDMTSLDQRVV